MTEQMRLKSYLLDGLFIMDLSLQSIKTNRYPFWQLSIDHNMDVHKDVHYQV